MLFVLRLHLFYNLNVFFSVISGNIEDENVPCPGPELLLGYKTNSHYMSLLPRVAAPSMSQLHSPSHSIR